MDVSVVILNYNTYQLTVNCINSIIEKTKDVEIEIILVDNASTECPPELFLKHFPDIILVPNITNLGFSKGNNIGIDLAKANCVLLINSDTQLINNAIKFTYDYLMTRKNVGAVTGKIVFPDGSPQSVCQRFPSIRFQLIELFRIHKFLTKRKAGRLLLGSFFDYKEDIKADWIWGTYFMFKKNIISNLPEGKLDDSNFMYGEDMQWCLDIKNIGYEIHYNKDAEIIHYLGASKGLANEMIKNNYNIFLNRNFAAFHKLIIKLLSYFLSTSS